MGYEDSKIDFPCPECHQKFEISLHQLFPRAVLACPICGATSSGGELSEINQGLRTLARELILMKLQKGLNKRVK